jgi:PAS domain S-box-containing protein
MSPIRVLLIDDDEQQYAFVRYLLEDVATGGYAIQWASTYAEGLKRLAAGAADVALVDYRIGARSGLDLIQEATADQELETPLIMLTGQGDRAVDLQAMALGAAEYLSKSELTPELLDRTLRYAVRHAEALKLLREREERFRALIQNTWDAILVLDPDFRVIFASESTRTVSGFDAVELADRDVCGLVHASDVERLRAEMISCLANPGCRVMTTCRSRHKDGSWRDCELVAVNRLDDPAVRGLVVNYRDITERTRAQAQSTYLASMVSASQDAIIGTSIDGTIRTWNKGAERLYKYKPEEIIGRPASVLFPPGRQKEFDALRKRLEAGETLAPFDAVRVAADGSQLIVSLSISTVRDAHGEIVGTSSVVRDITEQRHAQAAIRENEREYRTLFDESPVGTAHADLNGRWVRVNRRLCEILGYAEQELTRESLLSIAHPDESEVASQALRDLLAGALAQFETESRFRRRDGSYIWVQPNIRLHRDGSGKPRYFVVAIQDISARKSAEQRLWHTVRHLQAVVSSLPVALWALDKAGIITLSEGQLLPRFGVKPGDLVGRSQFELFKDHPDVLEATRRAIAGEAVHTIGSIADGIFEVWYSPLAGEGGAVVGTIGITLEITDRLRLEEKYRQAQKMEAIGRLAGGIAHDFNNLLTAIIGYGELALADLPEGSTVREDVMEMFKAGQSAAGLTHQLLAFSRQQKLQPQVVDVNATVDRMQSLLRRLIGEDVTLETRLADGLDPIYADPSQIEQIVMNLAVNARDAMPGGGHLLVETRNIQVKPEMRDQTGSSEGAHVLLTVSDTGTGMSQEVKHRLFEPFFTTKERGKGTGLGLATVYGIVNQSGGSIAVDSELGKGTSFRIYMPVDPPPAVRAAQGPESAAANLRGTETILLVEDQSEVRSVARDILQRQGYTVLEAAGPAEAVRIAGASVPIALLLTDIVLPDMSGGELASRLRSNRPGLRIIYTSGYSGDRLVEYDQTDPGAPFVQKPFTPRSLLAKVREVLDAPPAVPSPE